MASRKQLQAMLNESICPICLDFYRNPVTTTCGHSFCRPCLLQRWEIVQAPFPCPQCQQEFRQRSVKPNKTMMRKAERARRQLACLEEEQQGSPAQARRLAPTGQAVGEPVLPKAGARRARSSASREEVVDQYKEMCRNKLDSLQKQKERLYQCRGIEEENRVELKKYAEDLQENIVSEFAQLQQFLRSEEAALISRLEAKQKRVSRQIEDNLMKISKDIASINQTISDVQNLVALQETELLQDLRSNIKWSAAKYQNPTRLSVALSMGEFSGPLQYVMWRRMLKIIRTVPAPLVLNPKTAHPHLSLSADCRRLRAGSGKDRSRRPARFGRCLCVLGSEGYASGRNYWEVKVRMNWDWVVGVAVASVVGKESIEPGPKAGVWAVRRSGEEYAALTSPHTPLHLSVRPQRIGVYLDYQEGQVSFYNADDMSHLFTFTDIFTEELYPYFYTGCKMDSLKLVTLHV